METAKSTGWAVDRSSDTLRTSLLSDDKKVRSDVLPVSHKATSLTALSHASSVGAQQRGDALRAGFRRMTGVHENKGDDAVQVAAGSPATVALNEPVPVALTAQEIDATWQKIVANDKRDSALCGVRSMSDNGELEAREAAYRNQVGAWIAAADTPAQVQQQKFAIQLRAIDKSRMLPGDILLRKESPPLSIAHANTLKFHLKPNLNGIESNRGDHNIFHVAQWIRDPSDPAADKFVEIAEARGGLGTTNAMRALAHSIQTGQYWVYRARPGYGLPKDPCERIVKRLAQRAAMPPTAPLLGNASSRIAEIFAGQAAPYSKSMLSSSMRDDAKFTQLTENRKQDAIRLAADPYQLSHVGKTSDTEHYRDVRTRENAERDEHKSVKREGGDSCSTFVVRTAQTAALQIAALSEIEKLRGMDAGEAAAGIALQAQDEKPLSIAATEHLTAMIRPTAQGDINDDIKEKLVDTLNNFEGLLSVNAEGIAPKTVEHFCRDERDFEFVGVLVITPGDVLREEMRFDASGNPIVPKNESGSSERDDCCVVS